MKAKQKKTIGLGLMTEYHPRFKEFKERLEGPEGCNFCRDEKSSDPRSFRFDCDNSLEKPRSRRILAAMGATEKEIEQSIGYFTGSGGHCDCEVVFNVGVHRRGPLRRRPVVKRKKGSRRSRKPGRQVNG